MMEGLDFGEAAPARPEPGGGWSAKRSRRARRVLIATAIAAFVGVGDGASDVAAATPISSASTRASAVAKIEASLVRITVTAGRGSRAGSGLIVRADGYVLTSAALVSELAGAARVQVTTTDGRQVVARVVGIDEVLGLAVLHVVGLGELVPASFADASRLTAEQALATVRTGMALLDGGGKVVGVYATPFADRVVPADQAVRIAVELIASTR